MKHCMHVHALQDFTVTEDINVIIVHVLSNDTVKIVTISSVSINKETQTYIRVAFICKKLSS